MTLRNALSLAVLALPGCALVAPFDPSLQEQRRDETGRDRPENVWVDVDAGAPNAGDPDAGGDGLGGFGADADAGAYPDGGAGNGGAAGGGDGNGGAGGGGGGGPQGQCAVGETRACYPGDPDDQNRGICHAGTQTCENVLGGATWGACQGAAVPGEEACGNGLDDDCDGQSDEDCGLQEITWCYFCSIIDQFTDHGACATGAVPANQDGSCPAGSSVDMPECEPCQVCEVIQGFCENPDCCGDWVDSQTVGEGCQCWGCPGQGASTDVDTAIAGAEAAGLAFCQYMPPEYDSACGDHHNGCWVRSCGSAAACN